MGYWVKANKGRHISLYNTFYKIIAKVLAIMLKGVLPSIINHAQSAFIDGRDIVDNISITHEILWNFSTNKFKNNICVKIDIQKTFDSINRHIIIVRMIQKGFPLIFCNWVKACIMDVPFSVILNGEIQGYFFSKVSIRQGCPLSPPPFHHYYGYVL